MPKATNSAGNLAQLPDCYINVPNFRPIYMNALPEIGDSKNAHYNAESIIGRSSPLHTYHYSDSRTISFTIHLFVTEKQDTRDNLQILRAIQSVAYPRAGSSGAPFLPPPICQIRCGDLLSTGEVCVILQNYSVKFPTDVSWDETTYCPYRFDIDTSWWVVYPSPNLPDQDRIIKSGY